MPVIRSEVAGSVWKIEVSIGDIVSTEGDVLMILESMKMEIPVEAPSSGTVCAILVAEGAPIVDDQPLLDFTAS